MGISEFSFEHMNRRRRHSTIQPYVLHHLIHFVNLAENLCNYSRDINLSRLIKGVDYLSSSSLSSLFIIFNRRLENKGANMRVNTCCFVACLILACNATAQSLVGKVDIGPMIRTSAITETFALPPKQSPLDSINKSSSPPRFTGYSSLFESFATKYPEEKVHLHLDRDRYFAGDTIWFKSYFYLDGVPGAFSKALHVELYKDSVLVESKLYPVGAAGQLELPANLEEGIYTVQAYTSWMANFSHAFFYHFTFPVYRPHMVVASPVAKVSVAPEYDIQFLPEGGNSVQNIPSMVAFIAVDGLGHPLEIKGWIGDEAGDTIVDFHSTHDGMGTFNYIPRTGKIYYAHVMTPLGNKDVPLPAANPDGVALHATMTSGGVRVILRSTNNSRYFSHSLCLMGTMYGHPVYVANARLTPDVHVFNGVIPTDQFSDGILRISVVDEDSLLLAERVVFIRPRPVAIQTRLRLDTINTEPRGLNAWTLHFPDSVRGSLSISVTDANALPDAPLQSDIFSDLLLKEDQDSAALKELRGTIFNPGWYFRDEADSTKAAMDLVMLTHGWRTLKWQDMMQPNFFPKIQFQGSQSVDFSGLVYYGGTKKLVRNKDLNVILQSPQMGTALRTAWIDSVGHFVLKDLQFSDTAAAYFQVNEEGDKAKNVRLQLDMPKNMPHYVSMPSNMLSFTSAFSDNAKAFQTRVDEKADADIAIHRFANAKELKQIFIRGVSEERIQVKEMDDRYTFGLFSNTEGFSFDMVHHPEYCSYMDIFNFLEGRVPSLTIKGTFPKYDLKYRNNGCPALYLNELPITIDALSNIPISWIAYIKFIYPPFMGAFLGGPAGAIAIYLRRGNDLFADSYGLNRVTLKGYSNTREFYTPLYNGGSNSSSPSFPDYRLTLDWQPSVILNDSTQSATIKFYNNDNSSRFRVVAEGMDYSGKLLHFEEVVEMHPVYSNSMAAGL